MWRRLINNPEEIIEGVALTPGQTVLEVGCGSGFFTIPAADLIGPNGRLVAIDPVIEIVETTKRKVGY